MANSVAWWEELQAYKHGGILFYQQYNPDKIFFKEQQSQIRERALKAPSHFSGYVVCHALFYTANLINVIPIFSYATP